MPRQIAETELRVFVASPSDVTAERDRLPRVIEELNAKGGAAHIAGVRLVLKRWETDVVPDIGRPQQVVFDQLPPSEWDIFIGILWLRFGIESGANATTTGEPFLSGTEEEFQAAYRLRQSRGDGFPRVMFYRCTRPPTDITRLDLKQYGRVQEFFDNFLPSGAHPGLVWTFNQTDDFERGARKHLSQVIADYVAAQRAPSIATPLLGPRLPSEPNRKAALDLYLKRLRASGNALPLVALDDDVRQYAQITLNQVYIALDTTMRVPLTDEQKKTRKEQAVVLGAEFFDSDRAGSG
jgi:hypothetical protein